MFNINDIKNGMTFVLDNNLYLVIEFQHVKPGKGPAFVRVKMKNLRTGSTIEKTFNTNIKLEKAIVEKKPMQFLYNTGDTFFFMNMDDYSQIELNKSQIEDESKFLKEGLNVDLTFYGGELLNVILPEKVEYTVVSTEPAVKGNTASGNVTKDAVIETGATVKVPLFIEQDESIIINTKDGKYDSRA